MKKSLVIIGGGASGIICAIKAKLINPDISVTILEQNDRIGKKILKTGNGRCNIGNLNMDSNFYNQQSFVEKCFLKVSLNEVLTFFKEMGLWIKDDGSTRLYPYSESATTVLEVFRFELMRLNIDVKCNHQVIKIEKKNNYILTTNLGSIDADVLVLATGSKAQEKSNGYELLKKMGCFITDLKPGLVPLKTVDKLKNIQGLRVKCEASIYNNDKLSHQEEGEVLFKEQGLSGILSLNLSRYVNENTVIYLNLFPNQSFLKNEFLDILKLKTVSEALMGILPKMLVHEVLKRNPNNQIDDIIATLKALSFKIDGSYGYEFAQITLGGLDLSEINDNFSLVKDKYIYVIGELLDVDGASGGYNLHFAWVSGIIAAKSMCFEKTT